MAENKWELGIQKRVKKLAIWTFLWVFSLALVSFGHKLLWNENKIISIIFIIVNVIIGIMMVVANKKYLENLDELQKQMHLNAMGITLGVSLVLGLAISMLDITNVVPWDAEISFVVMIMGITYLITLIINYNKYQ